MQVGAVFGIIFALIVLAFVIIFGWDQVANMTCLGAISQTSKAVEELEIVVDNIQSLDEGSSSPFDVKIPANAKLCFLDPDDPSPNLLKGWNPNPDYMFIYEDEINRTRSNVWIEYGCGENNPLHKIRFLVASENFCVESGERLLLTNTGITVNVTKIG